MADVFISYKRRLRPRVELIAEELRLLQVDVWFDAALEPGQSFGSEIGEEVRAAKCILVCWSNDCFPHGGDESGWVVGEATIGRNRRVLVAATLEPTELDPPWNTIHTEDLSEWWPSAIGNDRARWRKVLGTIGTIIGRPGLVDYYDALKSDDPLLIGACATKYPDDPLASMAALQHDIAQLVLSGTATSAHDADAVPTEVSEWLERQSALSRDLAYEREELLDAVAVALQVSEDVQPIEPATPLPRRADSPLRRSVILLLGMALIIGAVTLLANYGLLPTDSAPPAGPFVQFASSLSEAEAQSALATLKKRHLTLRNRTLTIRVADLGSRGIWYRVGLLAGTTGEAQAICRQVKVEGGDCIVIEN
jgi:hypothetical protein